MDSTTLFTELLQHSISPIALISGVGLILLSVSNRLGRTIDRSRALAVELERGDAYITESLREKKVEQLEVLYTRSKYLRNSISGISLSILASSLLVPVLILNFVFSMNIQIVGTIMFIVSITGIIFSAIFLFLDVRLTLKALEKEAGQFIDIRK